jgi:uncharacterized protein
MAGMSPTGLPPDTVRLEAALGEALAAMPRVAAALLFGSTAAGRTHAGSDIDLGVLLDPPPRADERYALTRAILEALVGHVATERVDLVLLNGAPPALAFRVLKHGRVVSCPKPAVLHRFRVLTYRLQADFAPVEELFRRSTRARALAGGGRG